MEVDNSILSGIQGFGSKNVQVIGGESATKVKKIIRSAIRSYKDQKTQQ
jgi:hypothetical protein